MRPPYFILLLVVVMATCATLQQNAHNADRRERAAKRMKALAEEQARPSTPIDTTTRRAARVADPSFDGQSDAHRTSHGRTRMMIDAARRANCARPASKTTVGAGGAVTQSFSSPGANCRPGSGSGDSFSR
jgi:hypothetical protein